MPPVAQSTPTASPAPSAAPAASAPSHVLVAAYVYGYAGTSTSVPVATIARYVDWAVTSAGYVRTIERAGMKTMAYANFWRNYTTDYPSSDYTDLAPGGSHASAEAKDCSGTPLYDSNHGGGYETDARSAAALGHALLVTGNGAAVTQNGFTAIFSDDTGAVYGMVPCGYSQPAYDGAVNAVHSALGVPLWVNALGAFSDPSSAIDLAQPANVIGAMCESCYGGNGSSGDYLVTGTVWQNTENAEIGMAARHKIFWDYARMSGDPGTEIGKRLYAYASFLLGYEPAYAMFQEAFKTASTLSVMPETGIVAEQPLSTASSVQGYRAQSGAYVREFAACYYRGTLLGRCAVAVNPGASAVSLQSSGYLHSAVPAGAGVLDGGSVSFTGPQVTQLPGASAAILVP